MVVQCVRSQCLVPAAFQTASCQPVSAYSLPAFVTFSQPTQSCVGFIQILFVLVNTIFVGILNKALESQNL